VEVTVTHLLKDGEEKAEPHEYGKRILGRL